MGQTLTDRFVKSVTPAAPGKRAEYFDGTDSSFALRVTDRGKKSWCLLYRAGTPPKLKRYTLGSYPALGLSAARKAAADLRSKIADGEDPQGEKKAAKVAALKAAADPSSSKYAGGTFGALAERFIDKKLSTEKRGAEVERTLRRHLLPDWANKPIAAITRADCVAARDKLMDADKPGAANAVHDLMSRFFMWCVSDRAALDQSPMFGLRAPAPRNKRTRVLSDPEIKSVWEASEAMGWPGPFAQLLLLTAQREGELAAMRWTDVDDQGRWTIVDNKSDRPHVVPLPKRALEILAALPRFSDRWVFPAVRVGKRKNKEDKEERHISGFNSFKRRLDTLSEVEGWVLHDLRRTARTNLSRLKVLPHVSERILNHALRGVEGTYDRWAYQDEMADALERWATLVTTIVQPDADKVTKLDVRAA